MNVFATPKVVDAIKETLDKDCEIAVFFQYAKTPSSDDDGGLVLRYLNGATEPK